MANEVRAVAGWVSELDAELAVERAKDLEPSEVRAIAACAEPEIRLSRDGNWRLWSDGGPCELHIEPGAFEAVSRLAKLCGMRPEQYVEQLIKRHLRSLVPRRR